MHAVGRELPPLIEQGGLAEAYRALRRSRQNKNESGQDAGDAPAEASNDTLPAMNSKNEMVVLLTAKLSSKGE